MFGLIRACLVPQLEFNFLYSKPKNRGSHHKIFCMAIELCFCIQIQTLYKWYSNPTFWEHLFYVFIFVILYSSLLFNKKNIFSLSLDIAHGADLSLAQRGSRWSSWWSLGFVVDVWASPIWGRSLPHPTWLTKWPSSLSLVVEFCWFVVTSDGVLLNFLWGFVGLWWLVVGLLLILWWITMALSVGVVAMSSGCGWG